eukprot:CAMPEP_0114246718 /NCGR_PEP_ID=MMETSP0058-20121206/12627_1 /TAXON_ID=36894 /ORGANISM="Pyramimonas parkeae, CCMP726" /LENGTH=71 /DNA_ID=CAMNT_0001359953 /DNA_START=203 /DNA_END=418 /DNA_ORIENTATION=+
MAIDIVRDVFPGVEVAWERTALVSRPKLSVYETTKGSEIISVPQRDMSDEYLGDGVLDFKKALEEFKRTLN